MGNKQAAAEHKEGFGKGSHRTRGVVAGIREVPKGLQRLKKSQGCREHRRELNQVQVSSGERMRMDGMAQRTERLAWVTARHSERAQSGKEGCKVPS